MTTKKQISRRNMSISWRWFEFLYPAHLGLITERLHRHRRGTWPLIRLEAQHPAAVVVTKEFALEIPSGSYC